MNKIFKTDYQLPGQTGFYSGKVRDVYEIKNQYLVIITTDRISAFDTVLPEPIPYKGQILNTLAQKALQHTKDIVNNWLLSTPCTNVSFGHKCTPLSVEMVIRGYLAGHAWREYRDGKRTLCGVPMPDGMQESQQFPEPIITPSTKSKEGHDEDISKEEIIAQGLVEEGIYNQIEQYTKALFQRGSEIAAEKGLILVDTKYEFGLKDGKVYLIDEIHTPDSSRYYYREGYEERLKNREPQTQLSKEFVREWLMENGFQGKEEQVIPDMTIEKIEEISKRYIDLYEQITNEKFHKQDLTIEQIESKIREALKGF